MTQKQAFNFAMLLSQTGIVTDKTAFPSVSIGRNRYNRTKIVIVTDKTDISSVTMTRNTIAE